MKMELQNDRSEFQTIAQKLIVEKGECEICGRKIDLEVHHIIPMALGGTNERSNLQVLCSVCHKKQPTHREATCAGLRKAKEKIPEQLISVYEFYIVMDIMLKEEKISINGYELDSANPFDVIDFLAKHCCRKKAKDCREVEKYYESLCGYKVGQEFPESYTMTPDELQYFIDKVARDATEKNCTPTISDYFRWRELI